MSDTRFIVTIEDLRLRDAVMARLLSAGIQAEHLSTEQLLVSASDQPAFVILNTGADLERLVSTATQVHETWTRRGGEVDIRTYSPASLTTDAMVFRLWRIADERISVNVYRPSTLRVVVEEILNLAKRF